MFQEAVGVGAVSIKEYRLLAECIRSDQVSAKQIQEHLKDNEFRKYYEKHYINKERK